jgi:hypothetical protein
MFDGFGLSKHAVYRRYKRETDSDDRYEAVHIIFHGILLLDFRCSLGHDAGAMPHLASNRGRENSRDIVNLRVTTAECSNIRRFFQRNTHARWNSSGNEVEIEFSVDGC